MTAFLEKVARGIADCGGPSASFFDLLTSGGATPSQAVATCAHLARAAVEAMREPSDLMVEAGGEQIPWEEGWGSPAPQVCLAFQAMIGAALGEV